jgi:hypothetical protein
MSTPTKQNPKHELVEGRLRPRRKHRKRHRDHSFWDFDMPVRVWLAAVFLAVLAAATTFLLIFYAPEIAGFLAWPLPGK